MFRIFRAYKSTRSTTYTKCSRIMTSKDANPYEKLSYDELLPILFQVNMINKMKFGLDNMQKMQTALGIDATDKTWTSIHVGGTNGKGSVVTKVANGLLNYMVPLGFNIGVYTSPHIMTFRERICVNNRMISKDEVTVLLREILYTCKKYEISATFFEITTILAFMHFSKSGVNCAVIEVGLGGRLDSTNVIKAPLLSIITSIGLEHTSILGNTIQLIAREKCGIIKRDVPVICGPSVPMNVVREVVNNVQSSIIPIDYKHHQIDHEHINCHIATTALRYASKKFVETFHLPYSMSEQVISTSVAIGAPFRYHHVALPIISPLENAKILNINVLLDVGHNSQALRSLLNRVRLNYGDAEIIIVYGSSAGKDVQNCLSTFQKHSKAVYLIEANHTRAATVDYLISCVHNKPEISSILQVVDNGNIEGTIKHVVNECARYNAGRETGVHYEEPERIIIMCGSFFIMPEIVMTFAKAYNINISHGEYDHINVNEAFKTS